MAHWELKIEKQFADEIVSGMKNFEIRCESDKVFQKGDSVEFLVNPAQFYAAGDSVEFLVNPAQFYAAGDGGECIITKEDHPINGRIYDITYVLHGWGLREDYCAFAIKERVDEETAEPKEDIVVLRPAGLDVTEFSDTLKRSVAEDIRKMCADRPNCDGCIFNEGIYYEHPCMLKGLPGEWLI